jgi:precorrin-4 methylase
MAQQPTEITFEDIPLHQARTMGRGPRMDPELYHAFKEKIQSLDNTATRITIPEGTSPTTMKNCILRVAAELRIPLTVRKVPGGLLFWRSTAEDLKQAKEVAQRLQPAQRKGQTRVSRRRRT